MDEITRDQRSREILMWLRHKPERGGLTLSKEGWAAIPAILEAYERRGEPMSRPEFDDIVRADPKRRFEKEGDRVRARYGFSVEFEQAPHPGMPPTTLYYGTAARYLERTLTSGLRPIKRQYVHLSPDKKTAREVARRRDQEPAIIEVAAHDAYHAGVKFYPRGKGVWLSDAVPPEFLSLLPPPSDNQAAPTPPPASRAARDAAPGDPRRRRPKGGFNRRRLPGENGGA